MTDPVIPGSHPHHPLKADMSPLERLEVITSGHMSVTLDRACNPAGPTMYCSGIFVDPRAQSTGVGTALIRHAVAFALAKGAAMWAHLSDAPGVVKVFERNDFQEVNTVTVDLDEYASKPTDGKSWGRYSQHCMYRQP
jgi:GNAT superfamily N-acetyltransferase